MNFEPMGGFPPIIREEDIDTSKKTLEARGLATTSIVSISNIMEQKKKKDSFITFGSDDDNGFGTADIVLNDILFEKPYEYNKISYKEPSHERNKK